VELQIFDQDDISRILKDRLGIGITKSTFMRYNQCGFILMPQKRSYTIGSARRVNYHPLVPVEIATGYLLFRGDWLQLGSNFRIARVTDQDVFLGRLLFYLSLISDISAGKFLEIPYDFASFSTYVRYFTSSDIFAPDTVPMDFSSINQFIDVYLAGVLKPFLDSGLGPSYLRYMEDSYRITFLHIFSKIFPCQVPKPKLKRKRILPPDIKTDPNKLPY
jgi:hypothetical protein